jgi:hypothetical protein
LYFPTINVIEHRKGGNKWDNLVLKNPKRHDSLSSVAWPAREFGGLAARRSRALQRSEKGSFVMDEKERPELEDGFHYVTTDTCTIPAGPRQENLVLCIRDDFREIKDVYFRVFGVQGVLPATIISMERMNTNPASTDPNWQYWFKIKMSLARISSGRNRMIVRDFLYYAHPDPDRRYGFFTTAGNRNSRMSMLRNERDVIEKTLLSNLRRPETGADKEGWDPIKFSDHPKHLFLFETEPNRKSRGLKGIGRNLSWTPDESIRKLDCIVVALDMTNMLVVTWIPPVGDFRGEVSVDHCSAPHFEIESQMRSEFSRILKQENDIRAGLLTT